MPDVIQDKEKILKSSSENNQVMPLFSMKGQVLIEIPKRVGLLARILTLREVRSSEDSNSFYFTLVSWSNGETINIILDSTLNVISDKQYHSVALENVSKSVFNGHLLAFDNQ